MKRSLLTSLMVAFVILGVSACAPKPATRVVPTSEASKAEVAVQIRGAIKPAAASTTNLAPAAEGEVTLAEGSKANVAPAAEAEVTPADALKLMLLHLLVAR